METNNLEQAKFKMNKAKCDVQFNNSFFSYLSLYVKTIPATADEIGRDYIAGISPKGELFYNPDEIVKYSNKQVVFLLLHEILHLALLTSTRCGSRNHEGFNIASDLIINNILVNNHYEPIKEGLIPYSNEFTSEDGKWTIKELDKKTAEMVYDELPDEKKRTAKNGFGRFDRHILSEGEGEKAETEENWKKIVEEANQISTQKGDLPVGMDRYLSDLKKSKINWRTILRRYVQNSVSVDEDWRKKGRKSIACGIYMPSTLKEKVNVSIAIDTSGSIDKEQLTSFISEIIGLAREFRERISMRLIVADCEVERDYLIENGNVEKIKKMEILGNGGTAHKPIFNYAKDKIKGNKLLICFTDGYSDLETIEYSKYPFRSLIILTKYHNEKIKQNKSYDVLVLEEDNA